MLSLGRNTQSVSDSTVTVTNIDTGLRRDSHTNETGNYTFNLLPVGRYKLAASMAGYLQCGSSCSPDRQQYKEPRAR